MAVHILELPKFNKPIEELATPLDRWLYFLRHAPVLDSEALPETLNVPEVLWALGDLMMIVRSEQDRERYESRLKMQRDIYTALAERGDEEHAKGREEGRAEERAERWRDDIRFLQEVLGQHVISAEELETLSLSGLESLVTRLRAELKASRNGS
jgi:hypothetical protein